jgi:tetratricopeptide (TPR) repeat protein
MKEMTCSQRIIIVILGLLTIVVCGALAAIFVLNPEMISQIVAPPTATLIPTLTPLPPSPTPPPVAFPTPTPAATPTPPPTSTPTPVSSAPQTQYDADIAQDPDNPTLRLQRGYAYIEVGAYTDAIKDFDAAIRLDEISADPFLGRGVARYYAKEWTAALEDFDHALVLNPDLADAHAWRGYLLSEWGQFNLGLDALRRAIALDDADPAKYIRLGQALLYNGRPGQAKAEFSTALSLESHSVEAYAGRAMAEAELGDLDAAQTNLNHAMSTGPFHPAALHARAWFHAWYQRDHLYEASQLAQQAVEGATDDLQKARYLDTLGWLYYLQGYRDQADATLEEAITLATVEGEVVYGEILDHLERLRAGE